MEASRKTWLHEEALLKESEPVVAVWVFCDGDDLAFGEMYLKTMERIIGECSALWIINADTFSVVAYHQFFLTIEVQFCNRLIAGILDSLEFVSC